MPQAGPLRRQAEREYYYRQLGVATPQKRVDQLAREFYIKYMGLHGGVPATAHTMPLDQLESVWLKQFIITNGGILPSGAGMHPVGFKAGLWRQALVASGKGNLVTKTINDNRYTFYLNN